MSRRSIQLASLVALSSAAFAFGEGATMSTKGAKIGSITVKATTHNFVSPISNGQWERLQADSYIDSAADTDIEPKGTATLPYLLGTPYATAQTRMTGEKFESQSKVTVDTTKLTKTQVSWSATPAAWGIDVLAPTGTSGETAAAVWTAIDPVNVFTGPGDSITVSAQLGDGFGFVYPSGSLNYAGTQLVSGFARTDVPGLTDLFQWSVGTSSSTPGLPSVTFTSNPALGLVDADIQSQILSRFSFDPITGDYDFDSAGFSIDATFSAPAGMSSVSVTTGMGGELNASAVPEPAALAAVGSLGLVARRRR